MTLPATSLRKLSLRALSALALLPALALPLFASETASANCDVKINIKTDYQFDDETAQRNAEHRAEAFKARVEKILEKKGYSSSPGNTAQYVFSFRSLVHDHSNETNDLADVRLEIKHKGIESLGNNPENIPYLTMPIYWTYRLIPFQEFRNYWYSNGGTIEQNIEDVAEMTPVCSTYQSTAEPLLEKTYKELVQQVQVNKNPANTGFSAYIPENDGAIPKEIAARYCLVKLNDQKCHYSDTGDYLTSAYTCSANFEFKVKGDPRVFKRLASREAISGDLVNALPGSIVWNFPLIYAPSMVGKLITRMSSYQEASSQFDKLVQSFSYCEK